MSEENNEYFRNNIYTFELLVNNSFNDFFLF